MPLLEAVGRHGRVHRSMRRGFAVESKEKRDLSWVCACSGVVIDRLRWTDKLGRRCAGRSDRGASDGPR